MSYDSTNRKLVSYFDKGFLFVIHNMNDGSLFAEFKLTTTNNLNGIKTTKALLANQNYLFFSY